MKGLIIASLVLGFGVANAQELQCQQLDSFKREEIAGLAKGYVKTLTATGDVEVVANTFNVTEKDCKDFGGEFDKMVFQAKWRQVVQKASNTIAYAECAQDIAVTFNHDVGPEQSSVKCKTVSTVTY